MSDNRAIAKKAIDVATKAIMMERQDAHGDAENSFQMIADLWDVYLTHKYAVSGVDSKLTPYDIAQMMAMLKLSRAAYGNGKHMDHYADGIGYTALAAMLAGAR